MLRVICTFNSKLGADFSIESNEGMTTLFGRFVTGRSFTTPIVGSCNW